MPERTVDSFIAAATHRLHEAGISTARLDVLVLLEDVLRMDRAKLLTYPELALTNQQLKLLTKMVERRTAHEPLAYIRNKTEFYGRGFYVDHHVLEPRSESETMIDLLLQAVRDTSPMIIDVGTGSGALAITTKLELPEMSVTAVDIDDNCLTVAARNAEALHVDIQLLKSDLLESVSAKTLRGAILLCNLPYVPDNFQINPAAMQEPRLAIFGGPDGLNPYSKLFSYLRTSITRPALVLTEALPPQHDQLRTIAASAGFVLDHTQDFIQCFKAAADNPAL